MLLAEKMLLNNPEITQEVGIIKFWHVSCLKGSHIKSQCWLQNLNCMSLLTSKKNSSL